MFIHSFFRRFLNVLFTLTLCVPLFAQTIAPDEQKLADVAAGKIAQAHAIWWGFDANDSTAQLQAALDCNAPVIIVDSPVIDGKAYPWIVRPLDVKGNREIVFAQNAELLAKKGEFLGKADSLVKIVGQSNVTLRAEKAGTATLRMRKTDYHQAPYQKAEWRHALNIKSSSNIVVDGLNMVDSGGDGIYLGKSMHGVTNKNVTIRNVVCDGNNRQGISVITAEDLLIENTILRNTWGTAPQAGIDFEPNQDDEKLANCVMRNCVCENNAGAGIDMYLPNLKRKSGDVGIVLDNVVSRNNGRASVALTVNNTEDESLTGRIVIRNCRFENDRGGIQIRSLAQNGATVEVENTTLKGCAVHPDEKAKVYQSPIHLSSRPNDETAFGNVTIKNVTIIDNCTGIDGERPLMEFKDYSINGYGVNNVSGSFKLIYNGSEQTFDLDKSDVQKLFPAINARQIPRLKTDANALIPVNSAADSSKEFDRIYCRHQAQYWLYAKSGQTVHFVLEQRRVGRSDPAVKPVLLTAPSGKTTKLPSTEMGKLKEYAFTASETGVYMIDVEVGAHAVAMRECNVPAAINGATPVHLVYSVGSLYFYVPEGTREFGVKAFGSGAEQVKVTIFDPAGNQVWQQDNISAAVGCFTDEGKIPPAGVWRIHFDRPSQGVLEDFGFVLLGIPSLPGSNPDALLKSKE
ncbi:MAG: right-handed parallel beta-helix repeat-containing protein [Thermoguttaceae bacterium]|nr:right-handed parallel beta-helix repeat-containing protein [Thermoguttaceae bacterium]